MFGEDHNGSIVQRGIDEALACQDMLERAPIRPSLLTHMVAWFVTTSRAITRQEPVNTRRTTPIVPNSSVPG
jgi:hypothetical protein